MYQFLRICLTFSLIIATTVPLTAQSDSLRNAYRNTTDADERMHLAYAIAKPLITTQPDSAEYYLYSVLKDSSFVGISANLAKCLNLVSVHHFYRSNYDSMIYFAGRASRMFDVLNDSASAASARKNMALGMRVQGDYEAAIEIFFDVLDYYKLTGDTLRIASMLNDIGNTYSYLKEFNTSIRYQNDALGYLKGGKHSQLRGNIYNSLGYNHAYTGNSDSAIHYYRQSLEYKLMSGNIYSIINTRNNLCSELDYKTDPEECLECFRQLIIDQKKVDDMNGVIRSYINISIAYDYHDDCVNALSSLDSARYYLESFEDIFLKQTFLGYYAETLFKCGNTILAYRMQDSLLQLNDSIFEFRKQESLLDLDAKYQTRMKADSIRILEAQNSASLLKVKNQRWQISFLIIIVISIIGISLFTYFFLKQRQYRQRELAVARMREEERVRIARDMHDEIGSGLTRISLMGEQQKMTSSRKDPDNISKITSQSRELSKNLKEIIWAIDPDNDSLEEMVFYIRDYVYDLFEDSGIKARLIFPEDIPELRIGSETRRNLFMTLKEIMNNIMKHSEAKNVEMEFTIPERKDKRHSGGIQTATIRINDDGKGFDPDSVKKGLGLDSISSRAEKLGGRMILESNPGKGTSILLEEIHLNTTKV